ncbi:MAG: hypothetical protein R3F29_10350 [Planctomycetota bacterium]
MQSIFPTAAAAFLLLPLSLAHAQSTLALDGQTSVIKPLGSRLDVSVTGPANQLCALLLDDGPGPTTINGITLPLGMGAAFSIGVIGITDGNGDLAVQLRLPGAEQFHSLKYYLATVTLDPNAPLGLSVSNGADLTLVARPELAGNALTNYPFFEHVAAINRQSTVQFGVDPRLGYVDGKTADIYVVASRTAAQWDANSTLTDARGAPQTVTFATGATSIQQNTFLLDNGALPGPDESAGSGDTRIGVGYDVVVDFGQDGVFDPEVDLIDGYSDDEAGFYVVRNLTFGAILAQPTRGPHPVTEITYSGGTWLGQNTYYPTNIATMGQLPLVVVSHGNGHDYQWYNHIGYHLASHGFVVMSHQNNTGPGSHTAAETTLSNTDYLLANQGTINGGVLSGHIDSHKITWLGHSRGADGVARAYDRLVQGTWTPNNYTIDDIVLVSSMAPVDFGGFAGQSPTLGGNGNGSNPHGANFHLWVAQADADVHGCADAQQTYWYGLHERGTGKRQSISLYGVGHGDLHDGGGSSVASGPSLIGRPTTHEIMRGYLLALVSHHVLGDVPSRDFLWRQYESFRAVGSPTTTNVHVNLMFQDDHASGKFVIDDFQDQTTASPNIATSGADVTIGVLAFVEGRMDDANTGFTTDVNDPFNGFLMDEFVGIGAARTNSYGSVFSFDAAADRELTYDLGPLSARPNLNDYRYLSFRAAQGTRHPLTTQQLGDLTFSVSLEDSSGNRGTINIGAYGGGIEEPYQRNTGPSCGSGFGWTSEFETIRIRLTDFLNNQSGVRLDDVRKVIFHFGPSYGSSVGRLGLDEIELSVR